MSERQVPKGYKQTEVGVIPEDWECIEAGTIIRFFGGNGFSSRSETKTGIRWLKIANVGIEQVKWDDVTYLPEEFAVTFKDYLLQSNDVVMALTRPILGDKLKVARLGIKDSPALLNQRVAKLIPLGNTQTSYIYYLVQRLDFVTAMNIAMAGTDPPNIGNAALSKILVPIPPSSEEQRSIAQTLSDVDALIAALDKLIAKKRHLKTATMQQLLTGKKRLPRRMDNGELIVDNDGNPVMFGPSIDNCQLSIDNCQLPKGYKQTEVGVIPKDWEVVPLGEIGQSLIGLTYRPADIRDFGTLVLRSSNVQNDRLAYEDNVYVDSELPLPSRVIVEEGDILICVRNGSRQLIGKCALINAEAAGSAFGAFMSVFRTKFSKFVFYQFQSDIIQTQINEIMGATINQITNKDLIAFQIPLPSTEEEQCAIATVLSDMDGEIAAIEARRAKTQAIKQGMMQELLTGRTRLV